MVVKHNRIPVWLVLFSLVLPATVGRAAGPNINRTDASPAPVAFAAGVVPHDPRAGSMIEDFFRHLAQARPPQTIVLLSPDHFDATTMHESDPVTAGPDTHQIGGITIDTDLAHTLCSRTGVVPASAALALDHGITGLLPYIRQYLPSARLVPVLLPHRLTLIQAARLSHVLHDVCNARTTIVASVDFSHYLPASVARFHDVMSRRVLLQGEDAQFPRLEVDSWQALHIARTFARRRGYEAARFLEYSCGSDYHAADACSDTTSHFSVLFSTSSVASERKELPGTTLLCVGDIMLDRDVESLICRHSPLYPFRAVERFLDGVDVVFGNLEGPIVDESSPVSTHPLLFSLRPEVVEGLRFGHFGLLSLANNHTFDCGRKGLAHTRACLRSRGITPVGDPLRVGHESAVTTRYLVVAAFNTVPPGFTQVDRMEGMVRSLRAAHPRRFLVVSMHWGTEYRRRSEPTQQDLARKLIDAGADLVVGHHPHVIEEVDSYRGRLIFYSLGNFVSDQYFSTDTQRGLALGVELSPHKITYHLFPLAGGTSQPFLLVGNRRREFLQDLAARSRPALAKQIKAGMIEMKRPASTPDHEAKGEVSP